MIQIWNCLWVLCFSSYLLTLFMSIRLTVVIKNSTWSMVFLDLAFWHILGSNIRQENCQNSWRFWIITTLNVYVSASKCLIFFKCFSFFKFTMPSQKSDTFYRLTKKAVLTREKNKTICLTKKLFWLDWKLE